MICFTVENFTNPANLRNNVVFYFIIFLNFKYILNNSAEYVIFRQLLDYIFDHRKFKIGNSDSNYTLTVGDYSGNAGK